MNYDTTLLIYGVAFMLVMAFAVIILLYLYTRQDEKPEKKNAPVRVRPPSVAKKTKTGEVESPFAIPPNVPRTVGTIKIIAKEKPEMIIGVIRRWLRQR